MSIKGFNNQKGYGRSEFVTVQSAGSDKKGINTAQMYLFDIAGGVTTPISAVTQTLDKKIIYIDFGAAHNARLGDVLRFSTGSLQYVEFEVIEIQSSDIVGIWNVAPSIPSVGDEAKICRWVTAKSDGEGALQVSSGPVQYTRNSLTTTVNEDTVTPANNRVLPTGLFIIKDGLVVPVVKDTGIPSNTLGIPVEIVAASGTPINITAGDINVQLSDQGVNFDSLRVGDGSGIYLLINADGSINVNDAAVLAELQTLNGTDFATETTLEAARVLLVSLDGKDFSTGAKQDLAKAVLDSIKANGDTLNLKDFSTSAKQDLAKTVLDSIKANGDTLNLKDFSTSAKQDAAAILLGPITEAAPATDTASSGLNGRLQRIAQRLTSLIALLPTSLGQKTAANSLAVVLASDYVPSAPAVPTALTVKQAAITPGLAAVRLTTDAAAPSSTRRKLQFIIEAPVGDVNFFVGSSTVAATGANRGVRVYPGTLYTYDNDAGDYYIISDTAAQTAFVMEQE